MNLKILKKLYAKRKKKSTRYNLFARNPKVEVWKFNPLECYQWYHYFFPNGLHRKNFLWWIKILHTFFSYKNLILIAIILLDLCPRNKPIPHFSRELVRKDLLRLPYHQSICWVFPLSCFVMLIFFMINDIFTQSIYKRWYNHAAWPLHSAMHTASASVLAGLCTWHFLISMCVHMHCST